MSFAEDWEPFRKGRTRGQVMKAISHLWPALAMLGTFVACNRSDTQTEEPPKMVTSSMNTPEEVYRRFMLANLTGDEPTIRSLIIEHEGAEVLWEAAYPKEVAALLAEQYRTMEIVRVKSAGNEDRTDTVQLQSSASPIPLAVVKVDGVWRLDVGPIVEFRKAARKRK